MLVGSILDLDHFIAAHSFSLSEATSLSSRPPGHALVAVPIIAVVAASIVALVCYPSEGRRDRARHIGQLIVVALLSHQLRDATRRGIWFWPMGSTSKLPYSGKPLNDIA